MKNLLIKFGKIWALIRREGITQGIRRVASALLGLTRPIGTGNILFISGGTGDSARYRTKHVAEELTLQGFQASITTQDHPGLNKAAEHFEVFVLHRTLFTPRLAKFIARVKDLKKTIIFETDDLVYDPQFLVHMDYYQKMNALEQKQYEHGVGGEILADSYVKVATTTTRFLAEKLSEKGKEVIVVPNKLSQQDLIWAKQAREERQLDSTKVRVGYLSGTPSHNKDFATITEALLQLFAEYPQLELVLTGPLDTDHALNQYAERIVHVPFVPRERLFHTIARLDINLAPLEIGNPFCESKSELKFFEAGIVEVPTVAAATQTFREAIRDSVDGYVASTSEEWREKIGRLIEDKNLRETIGKAAFVAVHERYTTVKAQNEAYYTYLRKHIQV